jgi:hypothetical protein
MKKEIDTRLPAEVIAVQSLQRRGHIKLRLQPCIWDSTKKEYVGIRGQAVIAEIRSCGMMWKILDGLHYYVKEFENRWDRA